jgi:hypothetical protein
VWRSTSIVQLRQQSIPQAGQVVARVDGSTAMPQSQVGVMVASSVSVVTVSAG